MKLMEWLERLLFGVTAEERVALMNRLVDSRIEQALGDLVTGLDADADHEAWTREEHERDVREGEAHHA